MNADAGWRPARQRLWLGVATLLTLLMLADARATHTNGGDDYDDKQDNLVGQSGSTSSASYEYDPYARDFTDRCYQLAQYSGSSSCMVFMWCCSENNLLNKLNGDRCQRADSSNGCTLQATNEGIMWSLCRAYNCTAEVTTTTTTTTTAMPAGSSASSIALASPSVLLFFAGLFIHLVLPYIDWRQ